MGAGVLFFLIRVLGWGYENKIVHVNNNYILFLKRDMIREKNIVMLDTQ